MNFITTSALFIGALITFIICLPLFDKVVGMLPFGQNVGMFASILILMLIICVFFIYVKQNINSYNQYQGGENR